MTEEHRLISAESVTEGHPDKVCDQISDAILDDLLAQDSSSHVAVETSAATGVFLVFGEVTSEGYCDVQSKVRETLRNIGYTSSEVGLDADSCGVVVAITEQSAEINQGVARLTGDQETAASREERYEAQGAGDQGVMFGYATDETPTLMPLPIYLAHRLAFRLTEVRKSGEVPHLRPDGKTQVTIEYDDNDKPVRLDTVLISTQHDPEVTQDWLAVELKKHVIDPVLDEVLGSRVPHDNYRQLVNPTGSFILGGPAADAGLTFGTEQGVTRGQIAAAVRKVFDLRPAAIIDELDLKRPIYLKTAAYGHFGRTDVEFPWEKTDKVEELKAAIGAQ